MQEFALLLTLRFWQKRRVSSGDNSCMDTERVLLYTETLCIKKFAIHICDIQTSHAGQ